MEKGYEPQGVETRRYAEWEAQGSFHAEPTPGRPKYSITIPPPNGTGSQHCNCARCFVDLYRRDSVEARRQARKATLALSSFVKH